MSGGAGGSGAGGSGAGGHGGSTGDFGNSGYTEAQLIELNLRVQVCEGKPVEDDGLVEIAFMLSASTGAYHQWLVEIVDCLLAADDCQQARTCSPTVNTEVQCSSDEFEARCDGDVRVRCTRFATTEYTEHREDCHDNPHGNTHCIADDGWARCYAGDCAEEGTHCEGDVAVECYEGHTGRVDCSQYGSTCIVIDGDASCAVAASGCAPCDGDVAQRCGENGQIRQELDCGSMGLKCVPDEDGEDGQCEAAPSECGWGNERCTDNVAEVCAFGRWWRYDCSVVGATCATHDDRVFCELD